MALNKRLRTLILIYLARLAALAMIILLSSLIYDRSRAASNRLGLNFPLLSISDARRILVIAPHPDDETLAAGGLIQAAKAQGSLVRVVILTNGDGQRFAPVALDRKIRPRPGEFISLGMKRQSEALAALQKLGLSAREAYFLGYPDRGLRALWLNDWKADCPFYSSYTRTSSSPYHSTYNPEAAYCGSNLVDDLLSILTVERPDLIILPHPNDEHPDHWAASNFARLAVALLQESQPDYQPMLLGYLVHYGYFPQPRGERLNTLLLPPASLAEDPASWLWLELTPQQVQAKLSALKEYTTQLHLMGNFILSFARRDELFTPLPILDLSLFDFTSLQLQESDTQAIPLKEPARESMGRWLLSGADLVGWKIARLGDALFLTANTRGRLLPGLQYRILTKTPDGTTRVYSLKGAQVNSSRASFTAHLNLAELEDPPILAIAAEVRRGTVLDRSGWAILLLRDSVLNLPPVP